MMVATSKTKKEAVPRKRESGFVQLVQFLLGIRIPGKNGRELKTITKSLKKAGYTYYNFRSGKMLPKYAELLYTVYKTIAPLQKYFQSIKDYDAFTRDIVMFYMNEDQLQKLSLFQEEQIRSAAKGLTYNALVKNLSETFTEFQKQFTQLKVEQIDSLYNNIMALRSFCVIDYYFMLKKFYSSLIEHTFTQKVKFSPVAGDYVAEETIGFAIASESIVTVQTWSATLAFLTEKAGTLKVDEKNFNDMIILLQTLKNRNVFEKLSKLVKEDSNFKLEVSPGNKEIVRPYLEQEYGKLKGTVQSLYAEQKQKHVAELVAKVYPQGYVFSLACYNKDQSQKLENCNVGGYTFYEPIGYLKAYLNLVIKEQLHEFVETVAVKGRSLMSDGITGVTDRYQDLVEEIKEINAFDQKLDVKFPEGYKMQHLYEQVFTNTDAKMQLVGEVTMVNSQAESIIEKTMAKVKEFHKLVFEMKTDKNKEKSEIIENWKELEHYMSNPSEEVLETVLRKTVDFISLMNDFNC
jgi:hypothetical protein